MKNKPVLLLILGLIVGVVFGFLSGRYLMAPKPVYDLDTPSVLKTMRGTGVSFEYPSDWTVTGDLSKGRVDLDPPGEGPNPYSADTGEVTNPLDDIIVSITDGTLATEKRQITKYQPDLPITNIMIDGHPGITFLDFGETSSAVYKIQIDDHRILNLMTSNSDGLLNLLLHTVRF